MNYNDTSIEGLRKLVRDRRLCAATYTQILRKPECIAMLENADEGLPVVVPQRVRDIRGEIEFNPTPGDATSTPPPDIEPDVSGDAQPDASTDDDLPFPMPDSDSDSDTSGDGDASSSQPQPQPDRPMPLPEPPSPTFSFSNLENLIKQILDQLGQHRTAIENTNDVTANQTASMKDMMEAFNEHRENHPSGDGGSGDVNVAQVKELIEKYAPVKYVEIKRQEVPDNDVRIPQQHELFPRLLKLVQQKVHVYLVGPAGSGKTEAAMWVARSIFHPDIKGKFDSISLCRQTSKGDLLGYRDANGVYRESSLVRIYRDGGVFLFDEVDQATDSIMKLVNMALAQNSMSTPNGMVKRHANFYAIAAANTYGSGADRMYCGANQLDASTLNRFYFLEWGYDDKLEEFMVGAKPDSTKCTPKKTPTPAQWLYVVRVARKRIAEQKLRMVVSPRTALNGVKSIHAGECLQDMLDGLIYQGATADKQKQIFDTKNDWSTEFEPVPAEEKAELEPDTTASF